MTTSPPALENEAKKTTTLPAEVQKITLSESKFATNLERFRYFCKDLPSPDLFIDYNFLFLISSCLARKVWVGEGEEDYFKLYPNLFLIFVADPGIGKSLPASAVNKILGDLKETKINKNTGSIEERKLIKLGPDAITFEKLVLRSAASSTVVQWPNSPKKIYHHTSTSFCLGDEMGMLFCDHTKRVVSFLTQGWDCRNIETDTIKHGTLVIKDVCINFLGCSTPEGMADLIKTKILDLGFTARAIFIFGERKRQSVYKIKIEPEQETELEHLKKHLRKLCYLTPALINYTPEADEYLKTWTEKLSEKRINDHRKLKDYYARKHAHLIKLAINMHYAESLEPILTVDDFKAAEKILLRTEPFMHRALAASGENKIYQLTEEIKIYLKYRDSTTLKKLSLDFFSQAPNGIKSIEEVINFLLETGQITKYTNDGKIYIKLISL